MRVSGRGAAAVADAAAVAAVRRRKFELVLRQEHLVELAVVEPLSRGFARRTSRNFHLRNKKKFSIDDTTVPQTD